MKTVFLILAFCITMMAQGQKLTKYVITFPDNRYYVESFTGDTLKDGSIPVLCAGITKATFTLYAEEDTPWLLLVTNMSTKKTYNLLLFPTDNRKEGYLFNNRDAVLGNQNFYSSTKIQKNGKR